MIGLLGGIGSGKSAVARELGACGAEVVDADRIARRVAETPRVRREVARRFGKDVLRSDGRLDRAKLAERVFRDAAARSRLNALIHPAVLREIRRRIVAARRRGRPAVLDVPLLAETRLRRLCDRLLFVRCTHATRVRRVAGRGWARAELARRECAQLPLKIKRKLADSVIDNDGPRRALRRRVRALAGSLLGQPTARPHA